MAAVQSARDLVLMLLSVPEGRQERVELHDPEDPVEAVVFEEPAGDPA